MTFLMAGAIATRIAQAGAALLIAGGCKGADERVAPRRAAVPPSTELTADAFYADFASLSGPELLTRYGEGVLVTGSIAEVVDLGEPEGLEVALAVEGTAPGASTWRSRAACRRSSCSAASSSRATS